MSTGPRRTMGYPKKFMYRRTEGNFEETGLFYYFEVYIFSKQNQISIITSKPSGTI